MKINTGDRIIKRRRKNSSLRERLNRLVILLSKSKERIPNNDVKICAK